MDWYDLNNGFPEAVMVFDLSISYSNRKLRAGTHGRGVYQRNLVSDQPLPVELISFSVRQLGNKVELNWVTAIEVNNAGFEIERKMNEENNWKKVGYIEGAGNSTETKNYKFEDKNLETGRYSYRLKQIDFNGNYNFHFLNSEINIIIFIF